MAPPVPFKPISKLDAADILGVTVRTIENHIAAGMLPRPAAIGNRRYWHPDDFYACLERALRKGEASPVDAERRQVDGSEEAAYQQVLGSVEPRRRPSRGGAKASAVERTRARDEVRQRELEGG
ncbi:MAG: helix-turn-helix domain-containing protein [Pseudomonadota bacterium]